MDKTSKEFSKYMTTLGCRGEVLLREHDDFAEWGVDIRVSFRTNEQLQTLSAQRQSGGVCLFFLIARLALILKGNEIGTKRVDHLLLDGDSRFGECALPGGR